MANCTGDGNFTSRLNQALGSGLQAGIVKFVSALNIFLFITATLGNALILVALHKVSSIHPPTKLFFRCLAVTDLCVGLIVQPLYTAYIMNVNYSFYGNQVFGTLVWILCGVSVLTSTAISVDRLLALLLGLRYRHVVTLTRVRVVIICFWLISTSAGSIWILRNDIGYTLASVFVTLSLIISIFCYTRIHIKLQHHQAQVQNIVPQGQPNGGEIPFNIARYKKTVSSIMWVQLALVACYVPFGIVAVLHFNGIGNDTALITTTTLLYLNSSLNPALYCYKIREIKQAVKQFNCF